MEVVSKYYTISVNLFYIYFPFPLTKCSIKTMVGLYYSDQFSILIFMFRLGQIKANVFYFE